MHSCIAVVECRGSLLPLMLLLKFQRRKEQITNSYVARFNQILAVLYRQWRCARGPVSVFFCASTAKKPVPIHTVTHTTQYSVRSENDTKIRYQISWDCSCLLIEWVCVREWMYERDREIERPYHFSIYPTDFGEIWLLLLLLQVIKVDGDKKYSWLDAKR